MQISEFSNLAKVAANESATLKLFGIIPEDNCRSTEAEKKREELHKDLLNVISLVQSSAFFDPVGFRKNIRNLPINHPAFRRYNALDDFSILKLLIRSRIDELELESKTDKVPENATKPLLVPNLFGKQTWIIGDVSNVLDFFKYGLDTLRYGKHIEKSLHEDSVNNWCISKKFELIQKEFTERRDKGRKIIITY